MGSLAGLGGCGFAPIYATGTAGSGVGDSLQEITVGLIPDRAGQLLRQALQTRLYGAGASRPRLMDLKVVFGIGSDAIAIQQDNSATRARLTGAASWTLTGSDPKQGTLATGLARVLDGYDIFDQQYFAADLANESAQRRIAEAVADRIVQQLAIYFRKRAAA